MKGRMAQESFLTLGPQAVLTLELEFYLFYSFIYKLKDNDFQVENTLTISCFFWSILKSH